jgi:putative polyketide hydroxylase
MDLDIHRAGADGLADPSDGLASAFGIARTGAVLVRPDGFVAWRAKNGEGASADQIERVLAKLLSR